MIEKIEVALAPSPQLPEPAALNRLEKELVAAAQILLKTEWMRVRRGELLFRVVKWISGVFIALAAAAGMIMLFRAAL